MPVESKKRKRPLKKSLVACDACRRRKGRCNGQLPCHYCRQKSLECHYETTVESASRFRNIGDNIPLSNDYIPIHHEELDLMTNLADKMQNNLDELKSRISSVQNLENVSLASQPNNSNLIPAVVSPPGFDIQYFGPTSTQYSANKAAQRVSQNQALTPTTDTEGDAVEARSGLDGKEKNHASCFPKAPHTQHLQKAEAIRLVHVYQHEIGQIYPLIDRNRLLRYVEESYLNNSTRLSTTDMNGAAAVTCVALAIALSIERPEDSLRETLFSYVLVLVRSNSFFAGCNVTDIITVILTGIYHFSQGDVRLAWRMSGIASRLAMELGLHKKNTPVNGLYDYSRTELTRLCWSIYVFDCLWSCATGLPRSVQDLDLDKTSPDLCNTLCLSAMVSYVSGFPELPGFIQGFIQEPDCQNDSLFDKLGKRIEDWRRVSLEPLNFCHPQERKESTPEFVPTLLYLRANQLRGLLLRPFFWGKPHLRSNDEKIKLGLELATDSIFILSDLDINSATYRRQIATFQHFLSSSVVLLILSIVHALDETGSDSTLSHSLDDIEILVSRAIDLIASYRDHPASSHELSRKLSPMLTMLKKFRIPGRDRLATIDTEFSKTPPDDFNIIENSNSLLSQPEGIVQPLQQGNEADDVFSFFDMNFPTSDHEYDLNQFDWTGCSFDMRSWDTITEMFLSNLE